MKGESPTLHLLSDGIRVTKQDAGDLVAEENDSSPLFLIPLVDESAAREREDVAHLAIDGMNAGDIGTE